MANWKMPTPGDIARRQEAKKIFGDKKLVVITGTSSGLGRKTARALLRTGKCVASPRLSPSCPHPLRLAPLGSNYFLHCSLGMRRTHELTPPPSLL